MKKFKLITIIFTIIFICPSCNLKKSTLPHSVGNTLELFVVTDNKEQWNSKIGNSIKDFFQQEFVGLPNFEPSMTIFHVPQEAFIDTYKANHMIFIVDIDKKLKKVVVETKKDFWAKPQRVIKFSAPDADSFIKAFEERQAGIMDLYQQVTRERIINYFKSAEAIKAKQLFQKSFLLDLTIPGGFNVAKHQENQFIWLKKETRDASMGIIAYAVKYTKKEAFDKEMIIKRRNAYTKLHIPGPTKGSYMKVYQDVVGVTSKEINFNGIYAVETRGMWDVENDFMAGPFINYTFVDERNNRLITIDAYLYSPQKEKRIHMKELEAILRSVSFYNPNNN